MTPKEKAHEIFQKYNGLDIEPYSEFGDYMCKDSSKSCAIIAVNELINAFEQLSIEDSGSVFRDFGHGYWREVKQELEKI